MKVLQTKRVQKAMRFYVNSFGFRVPYQIIVDGTMAMAALGYRVQLRERIPSYIGTDVQILTTPCLLHELAVLGDEVKAAADVLRNLQPRNCHHDQPLSAKACVIDLIGKTNPDHFLVATMDRSLIKALEPIPGVPILSLSHGHLTIFKPAAASVQASQQRMMQKFGLPVHEQELLNKLSKNGKPQKRKPHFSLKRKPKNPNPLSCKPPKKKKKMAPGSQKQGKRSGAHAGKASAAGQKKKKKNKPKASGTQASS